MSPYGLLYHMIHGALDTAWGTSLAIIIGTFILEDATMVAVGVMASDGLVSIPLGLGSLVTGIALGDFGLYGVGRLAVIQPWANRWVASKKLKPLGRWLNQRLYTTVVTARFLPGVRLPTYLACGFFAISFRRFALPVVGATLIWSGFLFTSSYFFGVYTLSLLGIWRWPIALGAVVALYFAGRSHWRHVLEESRDDG